MQSAFRKNALEELPHRLVVRPARNRRPFRIPQSGLRTGTAHRSALSPQPPAKARAFTLTEMLVVIAIVVIIMAISIPALEVWESSKREEAINLMNNLLYTAQLGASVDGDSALKIGLFFYVDPKTDRQVVWPIEQDFDASNFQQTKYRYILRDTEPLILPSTMRVLPITVVGSNDRQQFVWTNGQLESENLRAPADDGTDCAIPSNSDAMVVYGQPGSSPVDPGWGTQFHRNYFVILFDISGQVLTLNERAAIIDPRPEFYQPENAVPSPGVVGFHTHLAVLDNADDPMHNALIDTTTPTPLPIYFGSTSGVLVYDDEEFKNTPALTPGSECDVDGARFDYLRREGRGLYIQGTTGQIIKGEAPDAP